MADLREFMPATARRIDRLREQIGRPAANELIRKAMKGEPGCFFSWENGKTFGTPDHRVTSVIWWDERGVAKRAEPAWMVDAAKFAESVGIVVEIRDLQDVKEARERASMLRKLLESHKHG